MKTYGLFLNILVILFSCLLLAACGNQWTKPGATSGQVNTDFEECERLAMEEFPVEMNSSDSTNRKEYETRCTNYGNQTNCTTRSSDTGASYQHDRNQDERRQATIECMEARGYSRGG